MSKMMTLGAACLAAAALPVAARAASYESYSELTGWINSAGGQFLPTPDHNMFTGNEFGMRINSYAIFYIPEGNWTSATLTTTPSFFGVGGPNQIDLHDVAFSLDDVLNDISPGVAAFEDLGSGNLYGSAVMYDSTVSLTLSQAFLDDANAAGGGYFIIGFTNATLNAMPSGPDQDDGIYINGVGRGLAPIMISLAGDAGAVPEPASWAMMIGGFATLGATLRRRSMTMRLAMA